MAKKYTMLPEKSSKRYCDELWSEIIKIKYNNKCVVCGKINNLKDKDINDIRHNGKTLINSHHLITRRVLRYRWDVDNGITLCPLHHHYDFEISAHTSPWGLEEWIKNNLPNVYNKWIVNRTNISSIKLNIEQVYFQLEEEYKNITGTYYRPERMTTFNLYLKRNLIEKDYTDTNLSVEEISDKYHVTYKTMSSFLNDSKIRTFGRQKHKKIYRTHKICSLCKIEKPLSDFHKAIKSPDGHHGHCKKCRVSGTKAYYEKNKLEIIEKQKERYFEEKNKQNN